VIKKKILLTPNFKTVEYVNAKAVLQPCPNPYHCWSNTIPLGYKQDHDVITETTFTQWVFEIHKQIYWQVQVSTFPVNTTADRSGIMSLNFSKSFSNIINPQIFCLFWDYQYWPITTSSSFQMWPHHLKLKHFWFQIILKWILIKFSNFVHASFVIIWYYRVCVWLFFLLL